jgi:Glycosyl hydrolase 108
VPRVEVFKGGNVQQQGMTGARLQGADYGPSALEAGLKTAGKAVTQHAEQKDQIEDIGATIEAQRFAVEHSELTRLLGRRVKESLGENADLAASSAQADLEKHTKDILGRASPRARLKIQSDLAARNVISEDSWNEHGFSEKRMAFDANSSARLKTIGEDASDEDDEGRAHAILAQGPPVLEERAKFYGWSADVLEAETKKFTSDFIKSRALKMVAGTNGSASAAIEYATANRAYLSDGDYNSILSGFDDAAMEERAMAETRGESLPSATTTAVEAGDQSRVDGAPRATARRLDPRGFWKAHIQVWEGGGKLLRDSNGAWVKYGINQKANPDLDVPNLTEAQAYERYRKNYFVKSGADKLPPALAAVHLDTFYLGEAGAMRILKKSGGDVDRYVALRHEWLNGLARRDPKQFAGVRKGWENRTNAVAAFADRQGGDGSSAPIPIAINTSMRSVEDKIMARTDVGLKYKNKLLGAYRDQQRGMREERDLRESESNRRLTEAALELGDNFTSITQLPANVVAGASPSALATFTNMAKGNKESKPLSPELAAEIEFVETTDPKRYASQEFRDYIVKQGAPLSTVRTVAARQGQIAGALANPKAVDPIADGSLWTIAKPAFEGTGIHLDTLESGSKAVDATKREKERVGDAQRKAQAVGHLRDQMQRWMAINPGKKPGDDVIRGMVGWSLLNINGKRRFEASDQEIYLAIPAAQRQAILREVFGGRVSQASTQERINAVVSYRREVEARAGRR